MANDDLMIQRAIRSRLKTLVVCSITEAVSVSVGLTSDYVRSSGSFVTDGFEVGMEVTAASFTKSANNGTSVVIGVSATRLSVDRLLVNEASGTRTVSVKLPSRVAWENFTFDPTVGAPYIEEFYVPGPAPSQPTSGNPDVPETERFPSYQVQVHVPAEVGNEAPNRYAKAIIDLFKHQTLILSDGDFLRVRTDVGPFRGQLLPSKPGWVVVPVFISFWLRTFN